MTERLFSRPRLRSRFDRPSVSAPAAEPVELQPDFRPAELPWVLILQEAVRLPSREAQRQLLEHHLRSVLKEAYRTPLSHYGMVIRPDVAGRELDLFDDQYLLTSVRQRCQRIEQASFASEGQKRRYRRETAQVERLLNHLTERLVLLADQDVTAVVPWLVEQLAQAEQSAKSDNQPAVTDEALAQRLQQDGWVRDVVDRVEPEIRAQLGWAEQSAHQECWFGPQWLYIMPQSRAHEGNQSVYVLAQLCYLPALHTWAVLQHHHMAPLSWDTHDRVLQTYAADYRPARRPWLAQLTGQAERRVMAQCVQLPSWVQQRSAEQTVQQLFYSGGGWQALAIEVGRPNHQQLAQAEQSLPTYTEHLLRAMKLVSAYVPTDSTLWHQWLDQAMAKTLAGLLHGEPLSASQMVQWLGNLEAMLQQDAAHPEKLKQQHFQLSVAATPFLASPIGSSLECVLFSWLSPSSSKGLSSLWKGEYWQRRPGMRCRQCRREKKPDGKPLLLGPCNICQDCENHLNGRHQPAEVVSPDSARAQSTSQPEKVTTHHQPRSVGLSHFVAGLLA